MCIDLLLEGGFGNKFLQEELGAMSGGGCMQPSPIEITMLNQPLRNGIEWWNGWLTTKRFFPYILSRSA